MTISRIVTTAGIAGVMCIGLSSVAFASADVTANQTGASSQINVASDSTNSTVVNNHENFNVVNNSTNVANSGDINANGNTTVGSLTTGDANATSTTTTTIDAATVLPFPGSGGTGGNSNGNGGGNGGGGAVTTSNIGGAGGSGVKTAAISMLPQTGPSIPVNVSALRHQVQTAEAVVPQLVNKTQGFSTGLLVAAAILSLLGAAGSAYYSVKGQVRA